MNDAVIQMLCDVIRQFGPDIVHDPGRLASILRDRGAKHKRDVGCLLAGLQAGLPKEIASSSAVPWEVLQTRLKNRLLEDSPLADDAARDCVVAWGKALGRATTSTRPLPNDRTQPAPQPGPTRRVQHDLTPPKPRRIGGVLLCLAVVAVMIGSIAATLFWPSTPKQNSEPKKDPGTPPELIARREVLGLGTPYAVVVGIDACADATVRRRGKAEGDARALFALLSDTAHLGVEKSRSRLLVGSEATRENILQALRNAARNAGRDDPLLIAFFTQGAKQGHDDYLLSSDTDASRLAQTALSAANVRETLAGLTSRRVAVFLDVDFRAQKSSDGSIPNFEDGGMYRAFIGNDGSDSKGPTPGRVLFRATDGRTASLELATNGAFAQALLAGLRGEADNTDGETDGVVTAPELGTFLSKRITELLREHAKDEDQQQQGYASVGGAERDFAMSINPGVVTTSERRLAKFGELARKSAGLKDLTDEGRDLLRRTPRNKHRQQLRKEYVKLTEGGSEADFLRRRTELHDQTKLPRADAETFADKILQAIPIAEKEHFLTFERSELLSATVRGLYHHTEESLPKVISDRLGNVGSLAQQKELLADARLHLGSREDLRDHKDIDTAMSAMLSWMDSYSYYRSPKQVALEGQVHGDFVGVGIQTTTDFRTGQLKVASPILDSPAYKAGIRAGDIISHITRETDDSGAKLEPPEVTATRGKSFDEVVRKIRGKEGTVVRLTILREGVIQQMQFNLTRSRIKPESVVGYRRKDDDRWDYMLDPTRRIAYVRIIGFEEHTDTDFYAALAAIKAQGALGLVLDLRGNGGGLLRTSINCAGALVGDQLVCKSQNRSGNVQQYKGRLNGSYTDIPLVCLIDGNTASASEIVLSCLQDHKRATLIGVRTFGKGCSQRPMGFDGGEIALTTDLIYRPSGGCLHRYNHAGKEAAGWGVTPDKEVKRTPYESESLIRWQQHMLDILPAEKRAGAKVDFDDKQLAAALAHLSSR